ncbi:DUF3087 family protein [Shewanella psychrotolerans]|uniref:DUF3087 family protein n=1 Tax=Shewanella psychrotolerans TaxID=2864206 RepID=UPI001C6563DD|nr:DUF3087 family protein [Shewanella psychrotolerans]QYK00895.1 DUF3087 domain-containing protein [Shewanella psychrotolerans]
MKLVEVDKVLYRQRLNRVIGVFIGSLALLSLLFGQVLISLFGHVEVQSGEPTGNLHLNFLGVLIAFAICAGGLYLKRHNDYLKEIYYVSRLKALQNRIYRKLKAIKREADNDNVDALIILSFYFTSLKLVYLLDDNTLTLNQLDSELTAIKQRIELLGLAVTEHDFDVELLNRF